MVRVLINDLPAIVSRLLSSRWEETTSPMVADPAGIRGRYSLIVTSISQQRSDPRVGENAWLPHRGVSEGEIGRGTCAVGYQHTPCRYGVGVGGVLSLTEAGHTFEESSLVRRVQSALPRVGPGAEMKILFRFRSKRCILYSCVLHAFVSLFLLLLFTFVF